MAAGRTGISTLVSKFAAVFGTNGTARSMSGLLSSSRQVERIDPKVFQMVELAVVGHAGQVRKGSGEPYVLHPLRAAKTLASLGCRQEVVLAAVAHDLLEDTSISADQIRESFGEEIVELVRGASEDKSLPLDERKEKFLQDLTQRPTEVLLIVGADKLDYLTSDVRDLAQHGEELWTRFKQPKEKRAKMYRSFIGLLRARAKESTPAQQLAAKLDKLADQVYGPIAG